MIELQSFTYQTNEVRTVQRNGEPWFVLRDVCEVLCIGSPHKVYERLDEDEKGRSQIPTPGGLQEMSVINESGLYAVILRSDKPEAKPFRKWVTTEVLPSIRKNGGYIAQQETLSPEELMAKALMVAQQTIADREARIQAQAAEISALTVDKQIMQPKAEYFDDLVDRNLLTNFTEAAKQIGVKRKALIGFMVDHGHLYRDKKGNLLPYANKKSDGLFDVKQSTNQKTGWAGCQTLLTPKGVETFRLLCQGL